MGKPKKWDAMSEEAREAWRVKGREFQRKYHEANREKVLEQQRKYDEANREKKLERMRKHYTKRRTQADADRFFQLMNAANEITKAISEINQSNEI
jgi:hypothetical protein